MENQEIIKTWLTGVHYDEHSQTVWADSGLRLDITVTGGRGLRIDRKIINQFISDAIREKLERESPPANE